jgi:hypothetical protein
MGPDAADAPITRLVQSLERRQRRRLVARTVVHTTVVTALAVGAFYFTPFTGDSLTLWRVVLAAACMVAVVVLQIRAVTTAEFPQIRAIESLVFASLVVIVVFAAAYLALSHYDATAFSEELEHTSSLYFTITTLATVGYGDISAKSDTARIFVMVQMVADVAVLGAAIRLIVGRARSRVSYQPAPTTSPGGPLPPTGL